MAAADARRFGNDRGKAASEALSQRGIIVSPRPFRFGVLGESVCSAAELVNTARRAEITGYATFLIRDHFIEEPFGHQLVPVAALATVAAATERLRVGSLVICNDYRHPVVVAKEVATLDVLSGGRFELGLWAGFSRDTVSVPR